MIHLTFDLPLPPLEQILKAYAEVKSDEQLYDYQKGYGRGRNRGGRTIHDPHCAKCQLRKQAQSLSISCYECPLPASEPAAKSVVFELNIPSLICSWRSTTYRILVDVLWRSPPPQAKRKSVTLTECEGLANYLGSWDDRLELASSTMPFVQTESVSDATEDSVCLSNNLNFVKQDSKSQQATNECLHKYNIQERCTLKLPQGCYETLRYAVNDTKHTSNEVISRQGTCPDGITVHEVHAFAMLAAATDFKYVQLAH
jgi:hypothetical protein